MAVDVSSPIYMWICKGGNQSCTVGNQNPTQSFQDLYHAMQEANPPASNTSTGNPFVMSVADGFVVSGSILLVWATAYGFKAVGRVLLDKDTD